MSTKEKKSVYKPKPVSGFPEWTPEVRMVEQQWLDHIRRVFESYGFCSIETPSVEELDVIRAKGGDGGADVDKEVYVLERLHKEEGDKDARLALHFDQTVPLARYTAQHFDKLVFPFKRYQMQRVWRGERPQAGRFREFTQCDIDVINVDQLPLHFDAEMPAIIWETLSSLPGMENEKIQIRVNNRKILIGLLENLKALPNAYIPNILMAVDKLDKLGEDGVLALVDNLITNADDTSAGILVSGAVRELITEFISLISETKRSPEKWSGLLHGFIARNDVNARKLEADEAIQNTMQEGIEELAFVMEQLSHLPEGAVVADLSIVRGLDYYTGTVYETVFLDDPGYGSICSGGRYDDLASSYIHKALPGVGISIGFSRLFARMLDKGAFETKRKSPADILVVLPNEERRALANETAQTLRKRGLNVETSHGGKLKRQLAYAEKKGIPYVWFPPFEDGLDHEVKNMDTGEQTQTAPATWTKLND
jgi:histidyl-tRNA synthetase